MRTASVKHCLPAVVGLGLLLCSCGSRETGPETTFSLAQLQSDYRQLRSLIADYHPKTFSNWREMDSAFDRGQETLRDDMTAVEFLRAVTPAISKVRCGHTRLYFSDSLRAALQSTAHHLPFDIRLVRDSLFVLEAYGKNAAVPPASTILSINGQPASKIIDEIKARLPADGYNDTYKDFQINGSFRSKYFTCIGSPEEFVLVFIHPESGIIDTATIPAVTPVQIALNLENDHDDPEVEEEPVEWSFGEDNRFVTLRVRSFDFYDDLGLFVEMIDGFFADLRQRKIGSLILDLRGNDGGDPYSSSYLLTYLIGEPFRYFSTRSARFFDDLKDIQHPPDEPFEGSLYVLVDGGCYSTAGHFCSLLKYHGVGTFIGVETGGSFACHGGYKEKTLANTGLILLLPHTTFIADVRDMPKGRGITPGYAVEPSLFDLIEDRDPVMQKAVSLIKDL